MERLHESHSPTYTNRAKYVIAQQEFKMSKYHNPKTSKTVEAKNSKEALKAMKPKKKKKEE